MTSMLDVNLTQSDLETFSADGFIVVDKLIDNDAVAALRERFEKIFGGQFESGIQPDEVNWLAERDPADVTRQICNAWKSDRYISEIILHRAIGQACARLGGWPGARINQDNCFWKPPGGTAVGFHQDSAYEDWVVPSDMVSCWIALDDTSETGGTVEYIRGSHRWGEGGRTQEFHAPSDPFEALGAAARTAGIDKPDHVKLIVPAGGGAFHHGWTWHGSQANASRNPRRSIVAHCMSSSARFHPHNRNPIYSRYQRFGDEDMHETDFPVLWREDGHRTAFLDAYGKRLISWGENS
jgi:phytanoyl-CoA hydroxylase